MYIRRKVYSIPAEQEEYNMEERLYSTGNEELDEVLERAFCEGYEYAQREFNSKAQKERRKVYDLVQGLKMDGATTELQGGLRHGSDHVKGIMNDIRSAGRSKSRGGLMEEGLNGKINAKSIFGEGRDNMASSSRLNVMAYQKAHGKNVPDFAKNLGSAVERSKRRGTYDHIRDLAKRK